MGAITASQQPPTATGDVRICSCSFAAQLDSDESLTGTPTVEEQTTSDLTITSETVSTATLTINGTSVAAGEAVQFTVSGMKTTSSPYTLKVTVSTDAGQTLVRYFAFTCADS